MEKAKSEQVKVEVTAQALEFKILVTTKFPPIKDSDVAAGRVRAPQFSNPKEAFDLNVCSGEIAFRTDSLRICTPESLRRFAHALITVADRAQRILDEHAPKKHTGV
jgi:hypothetical protein